MFKREGVMFIVKVLGELDVTCPNGYTYEEQAEFILSALIEKGFMPPETPEQVNNKLMRKYVDPCFNQWEDDLDV